MKRCVGIFRKIINILKLIDKVEERMANNHVRPGQAVPWKNDTGAPVSSGQLVSFGGGVAAKALHDIPAGGWGEVTLFQVHRVPLPAGLTFSPGDLVHVQDGQISDSGDLLGRFIRLDEGGWAEILILPLTEGGGGGGGTSDIAWKPTVSAEGRITWTRTASTTAPAAQNIMGPAGPAGADGAPGAQGEPGEKGEPGVGARAVNLAESELGLNIEAQGTITRAYTPELLTGERIVGVASFSTADASGAALPLALIGSAVSANGRSITITLLNPLLYNMTVGSIQVGLLASTATGPGPVGDAKVFVAEYGVTTAQEILAHLNAGNEPFAPIIIKRGNSYYTTTTAEMQADNRVIIRSFATLSGNFYMFTYTVTDGTWAASSHGFQKILESGVNIKTVGGQSLLGGGDIPIYTKAETDGKIAEAMTDVDNEHFHPVTALPDPQDADPAARPKENHEYVLLEYEQDGVTIKTETHYLYYGGAYHRKPTGGVSLEGYATEAYVDAATATATAPPAYIVDKPEGNTPHPGNVVQIGTLQNIDGVEYGIYEFFYRTSALPPADGTKAYTLSPLLDDYTIFDFIDGTGITSNGHLISSGRTDGTNRIIIQQFSKNNKTVTIRSYGDYTQQTALLKIKFIGSKNV